MKFLDKLLTRSNSYNYYKTSFIKLKNDNKKLIHDKDILIKENQDLTKQLEDNINLKNQEIISLQKRLGKYIKSDIIDKLKKEQYSDLTIAIKSPNPQGEHHWGDYFFALALKKSFEKKGFNVIIQEREQWYDKDIKFDINIILRGVMEYVPRHDEINLMWNISHPDMVKIEEYNLYDINFISSEKYVEYIKNKVNSVVKPLLQCTDPDVFYYDSDDSISENILFVGITRGVYRDIIRDVMNTDYDVSIYGMDWERFVEERYIKGQFIPNDELHKYYSSCKILLNDHWEDMRDWDFPSNRLFDALACGTFVISDKIPSADSLFEGNVVTYDDVDDLNNKIKYYLEHDEERILKSKKGKEIVLKNHTFDNRVDEIINNLINLNY